MSPDEGNCFNCGVHLTADYYCHGCNEYVCDSCPAAWSVADASPAREHYPEDHLEPADDDDELEYQDYD